MSRAAVATVLVLLALRATPMIRAADECLKLPAGVIHVALPKGDVDIVFAGEDDEPLLRVNAGDAIVTARSVFFGDGEHAMQMSASKEGIKFTHPDGSHGPGVIKRRFMMLTGSTLGAEWDRYIPVDKLKPGSVYITTPSVKFRFARKPSAREIIDALTD